MIESTRWQSFLGVEISEENKGALPAVLYFHSVNRPCVYLTELRLIADPAEMNDSTAQKLNGSVGEIRRCTTKKIVRGRERVGSNE